MLAQQEVPALPEDVIEGAANLVLHADDWYDFAVVLTFWFSGSTEVSSPIA